VTRRGSKPWDAFELFEMRVKQRAAPHSTASWRPIERPRKHQQTAYHVSAGCQSPGSFPQPASCFASQGMREHTAGQAEPFTETHSHHSNYCVDYTQPPRHCYTADLLLGEEPRAHDAEPTGPERTRDASNRHTVGQFVLNHSRAQIIPPTPPLISPHPHPPPLQCPSHP